MEVLQKCHRKQGESTFSHVLLGGSHALGYQKVDGQKPYVGLPVAIAGLGYEWPQRSL